MGMNYAGLMFLKNLIYDLENDLGRSVDKDRKDDIDYGYRIIGIELEKLEKKEKKVKVKK
jgi:hypothetical protein